MTSIKKFIYLFLSFFLSLFLSLFLSFSLSFFLSFFLSLFLSFFLPSFLPSFFLRPLLSTRLQVYRVTVAADHTQWHTLGRTPLDKWSACRRGRYLITHNTHRRQTSMTPAGLEPTIPASEGSQTHALDRAATEISVKHKRTTNPDTSCSVYRTSMLQMLWNWRMARWGLYYPLQYRFTSAPLMPEAICMQHNSCAVTASIKLCNPST